MATKINQDEMRALGTGPDPIFCERCHQQLNPTTAIWLDLNNRTNRYSDEAWPEAESQGCFAFGPDCARSVLRARGRCKEIRERTF